MKCVKISVQSHIKRTPDMNAPNPCLSTSYYCTSLSIRKTQQDMLIIVLLSLTFSFHSCFLSLYTSISHRFLNWACVRRTSSSPFSSFMILTVLAVFLKASKFSKKSCTLKRFEFEDQTGFILYSAHSTAILPQLCPSSKPCGHQCMCSYESFMRKHHNSTCHPGHNVVLGHQKVGNVSSSVE